MGLEFEFKVLYINGRQRARQVIKVILTGKFIRDLTKNNNKWVSGLVLLFIILNTLKTTVFNMLIVNPGTGTVWAYFYKAAITFLITSVIYLILFGIRSKLLFSAFYILQNFYIFVNIAYYMYFHSYLYIPQALALFSEGISAAGDLSILMSPKLTIVLLDLPAALYIFFVYKRVSVEIKNTPKTIKFALILSCLLTIGVIETWNYIHGYSLFSLAKSKDSASESLMVQRYGTFANSLADMALNNNSSSLIGQLKYGRDLTGSGRDTSKPNFAVIQVESLDSNAIIKQHNGQYIMPFLHSLAQQNVYYPYTLSYHKSGGTSDCEFSAINSVEPLHSYPSMNINDYDYPNSIIKQLSNNSYTVSAFHGNVGSYFNRNTAYPKMGYQKFFDLNNMNLEEAGWGAPDTDVFSYAKNILRNEKQPFFAYTITMSSHGPFRNVSNYYNNSNYKDVKDQISRNYMNSMSYVDEAIEGFVSYILANFKDTYIFIWGDHTPGVDNKEYSQASFKEGSRYFEFVPLIILTPDNKKYIEDEIAASFLDIAPTIANASGIPYSIKSDGIDLLNRAGDETKLPLKGDFFDRRYLFDRVSQIK